MLEPWGEDGLRVPARAARGGRHGRPAARRAAPAAPGLCRGAARRPEPRHLRRPRAPRPRRRRPGCRPRGVGARRRRRPADGRARRGPRALRDSARPGRRPTAAPVTTSRCVRPPPPTAADARCAPWRWCGPRLATDLPTDHERAELLGALAFAARMTEEQVDRLDLTAGGARAARRRRPGAAARRPARPPGRGADGQRGLRRGAGRRRRGDGPGGRARPHRRPHRPHLDPRPAQRERRRPR